MATAWLRSLRCNSNAVDDVAQPPTPSSSSAKKRPLLPLLVSCAHSSHAVEHVPPRRPPSAAPPMPRHRANAPTAGPHPFPTLVELPPGHPSRRVVEIIFGSSWSTAVGDAATAFPGVVEMLFRVHNPARTVVRFEEYRAAVRSRAARSDDARCAADGNEMMRFHCRPSPAAAAGREAYDAGVAWSPRGKAKGIRTFDGSGGAHDNGGGGGAGRRAMLVCRVIAGRVRSESEPESAGESVSLGKGELLVLDPRAVLPCFLIIYNL